MFEFKHKAIYGATKQGKTWLMKRLGKVILKERQKLIVYSGVADNTWPAGCIYTEDVDELEAMLRNPENWGAHVMMDEAAVLYSEANKKDHEWVYWFYMKLRHKGFTGYLATQYPTSIPRRNRINCLECYCFRLGDEESAKMVWADYGRMNVDLAEATQVWDGFSDPKINPKQLPIPLWCVIMKLPPEVCLHVSDGHAEVILL